MADATHKLSLSCRLRKEEADHHLDVRYSPQELDEEIETRRAAIGPEIADLLGILGEVRKRGNGKIYVNGMRSGILTCLSLHPLLVSLDSRRDCFGTTHDDQDV